MTSAMLGPDDIHRQMANLPGWTHESKALTRQLVFKDFREAIAFLNLIAFDAEEADHHPDVTINYKRLNLSLSTHSAGGVTAKDFALAAKIHARYESTRWGG